MKKYREHNEETVVIGDLDDIRLKIAAVIAEHIIMFGYKFAAVEIAEKKQVKIEQPGLLGQVFAHKWRILFHFNT